MKAGIIVDNDLNNDVRVLREIRMLKEQGIEIFVLCFDFRKSYKEPIGINITRIRISKKLKDILFFFLNTMPVYEWMWKAKISKHILENNLDVLHVHDLYMSRAARMGIIKSGKKIPMILDLHENYPYTVTTYNWTKGLLRKFFSKPEAWEKKESEYLSYADRIVVLSDEYRDSLTAKYPELNAGKFTSLPNLPDSSLTEYIIKGSVSSPFKQKFPVIFYYGVIAERRGIFDALKVFAELVKEEYDVNFLLIGPVDKKDKPLFIRMISQKALAERIHYIPWIQSELFPEYLEICDICVAPFHKNPQHESGVANKIYEYMLGAKPIIASNCRPQQNLIESGNCGLIFKDSKEFHDELINLLKDKELREAMGNNGRSAILSIINSPLVKNNLISLYGSIIFNG